MLNVNFLEQLSILLESDPFAAIDIKESMFHDTNYNGK